MDETWRRSDATNNLEGLGIGDRIIIKINLNEMGGLNSTGSVWGPLTCSSFESNNEPTGSLKG
jgi:hypothetical protein